MAAKFRAIQSCEERKCDGHTLNREKASENNLVGDRSVGPGAGVVRIMGMGAVPECDSPDDRHTHGASCQR